MDDEHRCRVKYVFRAHARVSGAARSNPVDRDSNRLPALCRGASLLQTRAANPRSNRSGNCKSDRADVRVYERLDCAALQCNAPFDLRCAATRSGMILEPGPTPAMTPETYLLRRAD